MDPWNHIRQAAADRRSGSVEIALRAAQGLAGLSSERDILRAARALLRAHATMAPLWHLLAAALGARDPAAAATGFAVTLEAESAAAADAVRWIVARRGTTVLTHSSSGTVVAALARVRARVGGVVCTESLPGGEGRVLARRLRRDGFEVEMIHDSAIAEACARSSVALVGADAVTEEGVVNKIGTRLVALAARDAGIGCYALASASKILPARIWALARRPEYDCTPLPLFDAVVTERGPRRPAQVRRAVELVRIPRALADLVR